MKPQEAVAGGTHRRDPMARGGRCSTSELRRAGPVPQLEARAAVCGHRSSVSDDKSRGRASSREPEQHGSVAIRRGVGEPWRRRTSRGQ